MQEPHPTQLAIAAHTEARHSSISKALTSPTVVGPVTCYRCCTFRDADTVAVGLLAMVDNLFEILAAERGLSHEHLLEAYALHIARHLEPQDATA